MPVSMSSTHTTFYIKFEGQDITIPIDSISIFQQPTYRVNYFRLQMLTYAIYMFNVDHSFKIPKW